MDEQVQLQFEELLKESRKARREDIALGEAMLRLRNNADFRLYLEQVLGKRIQSHGDLMLEPASGMDGLVRSEYLKGTLCGLCLARDLPSVIINAIGDIKSGEPEDGTS